MNSDEELQRRLEACRKLIAARAFVADHMDGVAKQSSAWDAMLQLYLASLEGREFLQSWFAPQVPARAHRLSTRLKELGMAETSIDPRDHRRIIVQLSDRGQAAMNAVIDHIASAGLSLPT